MGSVRRCGGENVTIYQAEGPSLSEVLDDVADFVRSVEDAGGLVYMNSPALLESLVWEIVVFVSD